MAFQLHCPCCVRCYSLPSDSRAAASIERMAEDGAWCPLGDGETIEDNVYGALAAQDDLDCPECGTPMTISQESLSRFARELLVQW